MNHELYMLRALELAAQGMGNVSPNPMVGCVIVYEEKIIGEGYHRIYGGPHAEPNATDSVQNKELLHQATLYVTLEPCNHFGKTPPCSELIIRHKIPKVVICNTDPNPLVAGKGIAKLQESGVEVVTSILEDEGTELNKRFFTFHKKHRPYVILKWAQTSDKFIARENFDSKWISNEFSRQLVHKWRSEEDAILVGYNTAFYDNPRLNVRDWLGRNPIRIVTDPDLSLPHSHYLFDSNQKTLVFNRIKNELVENTEYISIDTFSPENLLKILYEKKILSVIVEGGSKLLNKFIDNGLWDEARVFTSQQVFGQGIPAPVLHALKIKEETVSGDTLEYYKNVREV